MSSSVIRLLFLAYISSSVNSKSCTLDVKNLPEIAPVFFTNQKELAKNDGKYLKWQVGEKGEILCNGRDNSLKSSKKKHAVIECKEDGLYVGDSKDISNIACISDNKADIIDSEKPCINGGVFKYIGFRTTDHTFVPYIEICYNDKTASPIYTHHTIWGKGTRYTTHYDRPFFGLPGVPNVNCVAAYSNQKETLQRLLGAKSKLYIRKDDVTFSRGHLTPSYDGVFKSWQLATYYYINSAPQFSVVNSNNWETVERLVRQKATKLKKEIEVYTGVSGVLGLPNEKNRLSPIYLENRNGESVMPVPKWFWKIVKLGNSGIAFVTLNNPHISKINPVCKNVCKNSGWNHENFSNYKFGYTICCTVESLKNAFPEVPFGAAVSDILKY